MNQTNKVALVDAGYWSRDLVLIFHTLCALDLVIDSNQLSQQMYWPI